MALTTKEITLLTQATKSLGDNYQKVVISLLTTLCESSNWFQEYLFFAIKNGVTFELSSKDTVASYYYADKKIKVNSSYLPSSLPINSHYLPFLKLVLRHEVTHAFDAQLWKGSNETSLNLAYTLFGFRDVTNALYNALSCIDQNYPIVKEKLNRIALATNLTNIGINRRLYTTQYDPPEDVQGRIDAQGYSNSSGLVNGIRSNFQHNIISILRIGKTNSYIYETTHNQKLVKDLFEATKDYRLQNNLTALVTDEEFSKNILRQLTLWENLSEQQKNMLDLLYILRLRTHPNVVKDKICFPQLNECLGLLNSDCFTAFTDCQYENNRDNWVASLFEIHAVLRERLEGHLLTKDMLEELCQVPETLPKKAATELIAQSEMSISTSAIATGFKTFGYSFVDNLAQAYFETKEYQNIPLWKTFVNIGCFLFVYSLFGFLTQDEKDNANATWEISLGIAFTLLQNGLEYASENKLLPEFGFWSKAALHTPIFVAQVAGEGIIPAIKNSISGVVGSGVGSLCGASLSRAIGWETPHRALTREMSKIIADNPKDNYEFFIKAIKEKKYTKAFRIACNSKDVKAFSLAELLLKFKGKIPLDINEQAGDDSRSALHYAALKNNLDIYQLLLKNGAIDKEDGGGKFAAEYLQNQAELIHLSVKK